ncbi:MAG: VWA domain-containing protein [Terriglobales bacterium]
MPQSSSRFGARWALGAGALVLVALMVASAAPAWAQLPNTQGPMIIPKTAPPTPQPPPPPPPKAQPANPEYSFKVNVPEVALPVSVETNGGDFIGHLHKDNFRVLENGVPQQVDKVTYTTDAPMTVVLLVEFRSQWWPFIYRILEASSVFARQLQKQDWMALVTYDLQPHIVVDFTHNPQEIYAGLNEQQIPGFSEADLYDALAFVIDRMNSLRGRKVIVLITDGLNTFSHLNFDQIKKIVADAHNVSIFPVSIAWPLRVWLQENGMMSDMQDMNFIEGNNQLRYFAKLTGGRFYEPRFEGAFPDVFQDIGSAVRNEYVLYYRSTDRKLDGTFRKVQVAVVAPNGKPLKVVNQKGKPVKYKVVAKNGYYAPHAVQ